jgi:hypothetical protein
MNRRRAGPLPDRSWSEAIAGLLIGAGFVAIGGLPGVASAIGVGIVWLYFPAVYVVALGFGLLAALTIDGVASIESLAVGISLFAMLLAPATGLYRSKTLVSTTVLATGVLSLVFAVAFTTAGTLWIATLALAASWAVAAYGVHRYERVILGLARGSS